MRLMKDYEIKKRQKNTFTHLEFQSKCILSLPKKVLSQYDDEDQHHLSMLRYYHVFVRHYE